MVNLEENNIYFYFNKDKLTQNFNDFSEMGNIYYPLKTNSNEVIIKTLQPLIEEKENGYLISSISHFEILKGANINPLKMCFINVLAEKGTVKYLYDNGVRFFTFDNLNALIEFSKYADLSKVKIAIRLSTTQVFEHKFTHLGADLEECLKIFSFLKNGKCNDYGISFYIQNNLKAEDNVLEKILKYIQQNYNNLKINFISIGGLKQSKEISKKKLEDLKNELQIKQIILEVGRYLVENTIEMETKIIREKTINNKKTVIIKNGIYSGFFDILLYNKKFPIYLKSRNDGEIKVEYEKSKINDYEFFMCGGSSDSGDKIGLMYISSKYKDELKIGTKFIIKNVGAYFEEFFMPYSNDLKKVFIEE